MGFHYGVSLWGFIMGFHYGDFLWGFLMGISYWDFLWGFEMGIFYGDLWGFLMGIFNCTLYLDFWNNRIFTHETFPNSLVRSLKLGY
jgi:hypothetical protein